MGEEIILVQDNEPITMSMYNTLVERTTPNGTKVLVELKTLARHENERALHYRALEERKKPHPNGIECPTCHLELWDSDPLGRIAHANPPRMLIHCPACGYRGNRLA